MHEIEKGDGFIVVSYNGYVVKENFYKTVVKPVGIDDMYRTEF